MRGACVLAASEPVAGQHVHGCLPLRILSGRAESRLRNAMARFLAESSAQFLGGLVTRDAIERNFLVEGIAEEPPAASSPWLARPMRFYLAHMNQAKALLSSS